MKPLLSQFGSGVLSLTLNRGERANSFNTAMIGELHQALEQAEADTQVRCVVITGAGRVFSSGQDIDEMKRGEGISYREHLEQTYNPLIVQIRKMGKPVLAAVNGPCAGAALGLALACDLRIAHARAYFVVGFSGIALAPDSGVSYLLPKVIGLGRALECFFTNRPVPAHLALQWGIVNQVRGFGFGRLVSRTAALLAQGPARAFALGKQAFNQSVLPDLEPALKGEGILQELAGRTLEHQEGVAAFLEKRRPKFPYPPFPDKSDRP
ncbi:MAG: 2-(1,2-epoxy-1,2-dihydrophenyl)acetyl-CoA isomerase [Chloroflexi bacterium]|nr:2-(1,2-epoxy-1,2-dihydrophenyl)acetyl-CoA isomerase [Chloroflexota bacterium]